MIGIGSRCRAVEGANPGRSARSRKAPKECIGIVNESKIASFFSKLSEAQQEAEALDMHFFTRIILISLLDTLSRCANPSLQGNRARFIALIDGYAQWALSSAFGLRQLSLRLDEITNPALFPGLQGLEQEIHTRLQSWPAHGTIVLSKNIDPTTSDLSQFLTQQLAAFIEPTRYPDLLWSLRNYAIHEGRDPGLGVDFELDDPSPYYHTMTHADGITKTWELYIPNELLSQLLSNCAVNLSARLRRDDIDPWLAFPYHPKWY
jgi:hypothetical protein